MRFGPSVQRGKHIGLTATLRSTRLRAKMPPDSKDVSSVKDKTPSFHRLHTTDLERMKGMYLTLEELRGFDKYKVNLHLRQVDRCQFA